MKRTKLQFWSFLWSIGFFVPSVWGTNLEESLRGESVSFFKIIPRTQALRVIPPVEPEAYREVREFLELTRLVNERTQENLERAVEEIGVFIEENWDEDLQSGEVTQFNTLALVSQAMINRDFYGKKEDVDLKFVRKLVLLLRPYEAQMNKTFLDLQGLYREILLQRGLFFENAEADFLVEARAVFYFLDDRHRPYLQADQAEWILRLATEHTIEGDEFQGYLERALTWKKKQKKRELDFNGLNLMTSQTESGLIPKRKWGNKGFHSQAGKPKHKGAQKNQRPRSSSW